MIILISNFAPESQNSATASCDGASRCAADLFKHFSYKQNKESRTFAKLRKTAESADHSKRKDFQPFNITHGH